MVPEPTYTSGSLTDHVCVSNHSLQKLCVEKTEIISIYFFDHDAVKFKNTWR